MVNAPTDDLILAIDSHLRSLITERGDEQFAHVSDTYGCDRATWARRQPGYTPHERDAAACLKMDLGNDIEAKVCDALEGWYKSKGYRVMRGLRIAWNPSLGRGCYREMGEKDEPKPGEMVGHIDFLADRVYDEECDSVLIEVKSTSFLKGRIPDAPSPHYVEQTATYGVSLAAYHAGIIIVCRESGRIAGPFWLDLKALEFATTERAKAVIANTAPDAFPPDAVPRYAWQRKYCGLGDNCPCAKVSR